MPYTPRFGYKVVSFHYTSITSSYRTNRHYTIGSVVTAHLGTIGLFIFLRKPSAMRFPLALQVLGCPSRLLKVEILDPDIIRCVRRYPYLADYINDVPSIRRGLKGTYLVDSLRVLEELEVE